MWNKGQLREGLVKYNQDVQSGKIKHDGNKARNGGWPLERRNLEGMCPDQTLQVIKDFAGRLGRTPSYDEFTRAHNGRYISPITTHLGSWTNAFAHGRHGYGRRNAYPDEIA